MHDKCSINLKTIVSGTLKCIGEVPRKCSRSILINKLIRERERYGISLNASSKHKLPVHALVIDNDLHVLWEFAILYLMICYTLQREKLIR
mgnify:CR=1 FL=1